MNCKGRFSEVRIFVERAKIFLFFCMICTEGTSPKLDLIYRTYSFLRFSIGFIAVKIFTHLKQMLFLTAFHCDGLPNFFSDLKQTKN